MPRGFFAVEVIFTQLSGGWVLELVALSATASMVHALEEERCEVVVDFGGPRPAVFIVDEPRAEVETRRLRAWREGGAA